MGKYPYIVAEIGGNHNGDIELGKKMIKAAKECGADAVKFQLYRREDLWTEDHLKELNDGVVKLENVSNWSTRELGIDYGTSAFTKKDVDFCIDQKCANLKVASCDVTNLDLIEYVISKDYPTQIALGMASLAEIEAVVKLIPERFKHNVTLLHCVSLYPPKDEYVNLNFLHTLRQAFGMEVGYSDHTFGFSIPLAAIALGATVIEKHFTLDKNLPGWDHKVSANPEEMRIIASESKRIVDALGNGIKVVSDDEIAKQKKFRRSITTADSLKAGQEITYNDILFKRPGTGIPADRFKEVIGRHVNRDIEENKTLFWEDLVK